METKFVTSNQLQIEKPKTEKLQNPFGSDSKKNISFNKKTLKKNRMGTWNWIYSWIFTKRIKGL